MLAFSIDYYGIFFGATQSVELFCTYFLSYDRPIKYAEDTVMLSDNIKILRKKKGYSQETLAEQLHVVRQTISKWEKGVSHS